MNTSSQICIHSHWGGWIWIIQVQGHPGYIGNYWPAYDTKWNSVSKYRASAGGACVVGWGGSQGWRRGLVVKSTGFSRGFSILFTIQNYPHDNSKWSITLVPGLRCSFLFSLDIKHVCMQKHKHVLLRSLIRKKNGGRKIIPISITWWGSAHRKY